MPGADEVLQIYQRCSDERAAESLLEGLLCCAEPLVRAVASRRLCGAACVQDHEDLRAEVLMELVRRLRRARLPGEAPVEGFRAYVTTAAHHACDGFFRERHPQRHRLKNQLRYVLRADPRFAIWTDPNGTAVCGWARMTGLPAVEVPSSRFTLPASTPVEAAVEMVLDAAGGPVELEDLAGVLAAARGIRDGQVPVDSIQGLRTTTVDPVASLDNRRRLERLWSGILSLPRPQRVALLLHLRDDRGGPVLAFFPASGVASIPQIAQALEVAVEELAEMWNDLPLADLEIGARLRLNRQQVINLRSAARQRLARQDGAARWAKHTLGCANTARDWPSL